MGLIDRGVRFWRGNMSRRGYYSQYGQDRAIERFFRKNRPRFKRFVEVGAFDGVTYSNVRKLAEQGWSGVCIEPVPENFVKLEIAYRGMPVQCVNCACGNRNETKVLHVSTARHIPEYGSDIATFDKTSADAWNDKFDFLDWRDVEVPVRRLDDVLAECGLAEFDLLCIDAEGFDLNVLQGITLLRYNPTLVVVETIDRREEIYALMRTAGYRIHRRDIHDTFFAKGTWSRQE